MSLLQYFYKLKSKPRALIGLDIDHQVVRIVELSSIGDNYQLHACINLPHHIKNPADFSWEHPQVITTLKQALLEAKITAKQVAWALPHSAVLFKTIELDKTLHSTEITQQIHQHVEQYFNYPLSELMLDYEILPGVTQHPDLQQIRWVAARRCDIDRRLQVLADLGLHTCMVEVDSFALQRLINGTIKNTLSQPSAVLHIYPCSILFGVLHQQQMLYTRVENYSDVTILLPTILRMWQLFFSQEIRYKLSNIWLSGCYINEELLAEIRQYLQIETQILQPFMLPALSLSTEITYSSAVQQTFAICMGLAMRVKHGH